MVHVFVQQRLPRASNLAVCDVTGKAVLSAVHVDMELTVGLFCCFDCFGCFSGAVVDIEGYGMLERTAALTCFPGC